MTPRPCPRCGNNTVNSIDAPKHTGGTPFIPGFWCGIIAFVAFIDHPSTAVTLCLLSFSIGCIATVACILRCWYNCATCGAHWYLYPWQLITQRTDTR